MVGYVQFVSETDDRCSLRLCLSVGSYRGLSYLVIGSYGQHFFVCRES